MEGYRTARSDQRLAADAEALDQSLVTFGAAALQVIQQPAPSRDHRKQSPAGMIVLLVRLEVIPELEYTLAQDCDLNLWRAAVVLVGAILRDYVFSNFSRQCHSRMETPRLS